MKQSEYDAFAQNFSATRQNSWPEFENVKLFLKKGDRLLDLGCGNGRLRKSLEKGKIPAGNYFGLDLSDKMIQIAKNECPGDHFFRGDFAQNLPFGSENFEMVTAIAAFHHLLSKKDQIHFLQECLRVLKPNGKLFLTVWKLPRKHFWPNILRGRWKNWIIPFGMEKHPRTYRRVGKNELRSLLKKAGFRSILVELSRGKNYTALAEK